MKCKKKFVSLRLISDVLVTFIISFKKSCTCYTKYPIPPQTNNQCLMRNFIGNNTSFYFTMKAMVQVAMLPLVIWLWITKEIYTVVFNESCLLITVGTALMNHEMSDICLGSHVLFLSIYPVPVQLTAGSGRKFSEPWNVQLKSRVVIMAQGNCYSKHVLV